MTRQSTRTYSTQLQQLRSTVSTRTWPCRRQPHIEHQASYHLRLYTTPAWDFRELPLRTAVRQHPTSNSLPSLPAPTRHHQAHPSDHRRLFHTQLPVREVTGSRDSAHAPLVVPLFPVCSNSRLRRWVVRCRRRQACSSRTSLTLNDHRRTFNNDDEYLYIDRLDSQQSWILDPIWVHAVRLSGGFSVTRSGTIRYRSYVRRCGVRTCSTSRTLLLSAAQLHACWVQPRDSNPITSCRFMSTLYRHTLHYLLLMRSLVCQCRLVSGEAAYNCLYEGNFLHKHVGVVSATGVATGARAPPGRRKKWA